MPTAGTTEHLREERESPAIEPIVMRVPDACHYLGIGRSTLYVLIGKGEIEIIKSTHPVKAAAVLYIVVGDERCEVFDAVFGKCHRAVRTIKAVHPDQPVFRVHARREFSNQIFFDA